MSNWFTVAEDLLKDPDFGEGFNKNNGWYKDELAKITAGASTPLENARKIFAYVVILRKAPFYKELVFIFKKPGSEMAADYIFFSGII
jgi:hypothetical protein